MLARNAVHSLTPDLYLFLVLMNLKRHFYVGIMDLFKIINL